MGAKWGCKNIMWFTGASILLNVMWYKGGAKWWSKNVSWFKEGCWFWMMMQKCHMIHEGRRRTLQMFRFLTLLSHDHGEYMKPLLHQGVCRGEDFWLWSANWWRRHAHYGFLWKVYDLHYGREGCCKRLHKLENDDQRDLPWYGAHDSKVGIFQWSWSIQGLFDVHPSFQNSTLESFVSHGSGAPDLSIVVNKYHDMVGNVS